ncbi:hypothetical protein [Catenulispora subtropica]|uniref:Uncharacterized protein n=1 Tax=Catenulispora subtropica TaxID=450798 RepID=A0ABP5ELR1_9ACTN
MIKHVPRRLGVEVAVSSGPLTPGLEAVREGMDLSLSQWPDGKMFHDPPAFAVALDETVCDLTEVEVYRERGQWGSRLVPRRSDLGVFP